MIRVVVAEDSLTMSELLVSILESDPDFEVVGRAKTGAEAVAQAVKLRPNLITMDIHMPIMDGLEATKEIMVQAPTPIILVSSSANASDASLSFNALRAGALMVLAKPDNPVSPAFEKRRAQFLTMAKAMAEVKVIRRWAERDRRTPLSQKVVESGPVRVVAIAASTGGPVAVQQILMSLPADFPVPILIVQHIASGFVAPLATWLNTSCSLRVKVAEAGEVLRARTVYLAPDERHLGISPQLAVELSDTPPIGGHKPSGTYLFESVARACGRRSIAVILTGMGRDGVAGLCAMREAGGYVIAQDEATSVVFGMPREAAAAGVTSVVLPVDAIARRLTQLTAGVN